MPRTTTAAVKDLLQAGGDYDIVNNPPLQQFIDTASSIVDRAAALAASEDYGTPLLSTEQELIERWLAAWAYCQSDQPYASKSQGGASGSFQGQTAMYLEANKYGQTALALDYSGALYALTTAPGGAKASTFWAARTPDNQTP